MDRDIDIREEQPIPITPEVRAPEEVPSERHAVRGRGYVCHISDIELQTVRELGRFRTIAVEDLARFQYQGDKAQMEQNLRSLETQNLVQRRTLWTGGRAVKLTVAALTKSGKALLQNEGGLTPAQQVYAGVVKPAEIAHDAAIYRMYQAEAKKIEQAGGRIRRVVLDYELKKNIYSPLAKVKALPPIEYARRQAEVAAQSKLKVIGGKILLPDLRIEYESREGVRAHIDLELATHHYRSSMMRGKAEAGFKMYAPQDSVAGLTSAFDPEFAAQIYSF